MLRIKLLMVFTLLLSGCGSQDNSINAAKTNTPIKVTTMARSYAATPNWVNPIHLGFGETFLLSDETQISFSDVLSDDLCVTPEQSCQRTGDVEIRLTITFTDGRAQLMRLYTRPGKSHNAWVNGISIELLKVAPEPPAKAEKNEYQIWIRVLLI